MSRFRLGRREAFRLALGTTSLLVAGLLGCESDPDNENQGSGSLGGSGVTLGGTAAIGGNLGTTTLSTTNQGGTSGLTFTQNSTIIGGKSGVGGSLVFMGGSSSQGGSTIGGSKAQGGTTFGGSKAQGGSTSGGSKAQGGSTSGGSKAQGGSTSGGSKAQGGTATGGVQTTSTGTTPANVITQYIDATNAVRAEVTQPTNYSGTWAPLPNVTWSETVAASAQNWANHLRDAENCNLVHEGSGTGLGENLAAGTNLSPAAAVNMWASEKSKYTYSAKYSMDDFNGGSGHYTQLVWRTSIEIGCASANCGNKVVISCRYKPPGNVINQPVY
jgi:pathogenesis-related protein 1